MIIAGVKITFIGMGIVFVYLIILICAVRLAKRILANQTAKELDDASLTTSKKKDKQLIKTSLAHSGNTLTAVISAAIAAHHESLRDKKAIRE